MLLIQRVPEQSNLENTGLSKIKQECLPYAFSSHLNCESEWNIQNAAFHKLI